MVAVVVGVVMLVDVVAVGGLCTWWQDSPTSVYKLDVLQNLAR